MRKVWITLKDGGSYEHFGDLDITVGSDGSVRVLDYENRRKYNFMGDVFIAAPGLWRTAEMSDEYEPPAPPTMEELAARLAAYDLARASFSIAA
jgi:hypothetical protein